MAVSERPDYSHATETCLFWSAYDPTISASALLSLVTAIDAKRHVISQAVLPEAYKPGGGFTDEQRDYWLRNNAHEWAELSEARVHASTRITEWLVANQMHVLHPLFHSPNVSF